MALPFTYKLPRRICLALIILDWIQLLFFLFFFFVLFLLLFLPANVAIRIIVWRPKKKCHLRCSERGGGGDLTWHIDTDTNMHSHPHAHTFRTWRHTHAPHTHTILPWCRHLHPQRGNQPPDSRQDGPLSSRVETTDRLGPRSSRAAHQPACVCHHLSSLTRLPKQTIRILEIFPQNSPYHMTINMNSISLFKLASPTVCSRPWRKSQESGGSPIKQMRNLKLNNTCPDKTSFTLMWHDTLLCIGLHLPLTTFAKKMGRWCCHILKQMQKRMDI